MRLKDGSLSEGKKILIDGQQRITALTAAILKDKTWLHDISEAINGDLFEIAEQYFELNPDVDKKQVLLAAPKPKGKKDFGQAGMTRSLCHL